MLAGCHSAARHEVHETEAAGVIVGHPRAVGEVENNMIVRSGRQEGGCLFFPGSHYAAASRILVKFAGPHSLAAGHFHQKTSAHAQMHDQHITIVEISQNIFGAARQRLDAPPGEPGGKAVGKWKAQVGPALLNAGQRCPFHGGGKAALDRLHFRQFRHRCPLACAGAAQ